MYVLQASFLISYFICCLPSLLDIMFRHFLFKAYFFLIYLSSFMMRCMSFSHQVLIIPHACYSSGDPFNHHFWNSVYLFNHYFRRHRVTHMIAIFNRLYFACLDKRDLGCQKRRIQHQSIQRRFCVWELYGDHLWSGSSQVG